MIVHRRTDGTPKNKIIEENAYNFLFELEKDRIKEYIVGIDYASLNSDDCSIIGYFTKDGDRLVFEGYKILDDE